MTEGRKKIKITLNGSLVYYFYVWVGDQVGQEAIMGMYFMVLACIRLDSADGTLGFPDEVMVHLAGRRPLYGSSMQPIVAPEQHLVLPVGRPTEIRIGNIQFNDKLWVRCDPTWIPTVTTGIGRIKYLHLTNLSDKEVTLDHGPALGWSMDPDMVPRYPGYVSLGSRRYCEWQTLAFKALTEHGKYTSQGTVEYLVDHPPYPTSKKILSRPEENDVKTDISVREEEVISRLKPISRIVNTIEEKGGGNRASGAK